MKTTLSPATPDTTLQRPIAELLQKQRAFFATGQTLPLDFRKAQLRKLQLAIRQYEQEIFDALYADFRKPELESFVTEVGFIEQEIRLVLNKIGDWVKPKKVRETLVNFPARSYIYSEPYGIALIIGPWNYPFQLVFNPLIGAISAGNCAVVKPSELTVNTSAVIAKIIREIYDEEYIAVVEGGPETTQKLLAQRFDTIFFTGSTHVGRIVMKAAAEHLTPVTLELGGKSPAIVAADADLDLTARRIVWGKFLNAGQTCVAPDYLLVQEEVKEELIQLLCHYITQFYGQEPATSPDFARIINSRHFQRLKSMLENSSIRVGGATNAAENYVAPTVLDRVSWEHPVMQEEIFGPLLPVLTFREIEDAIRMVNAHEKPLALYFFSSNKEQQEQVLQNTSFGGGCINDTLSHLANPNLPFGGVGGSGIGSYHGQSSFDVFSNQKSILKRGTWLDLPLRYPPYKGRLPMLRKVFKWL